MHNLYVRGILSPSIKACISDLFPTHTFVIAHLDVEPDDGLDGLRDEVGGLVAQLPPLVGDPLLQLLDLRLQLVDRRLATAPAAIRSGCVLPRHPLPLDRNLALSEVLLSSFYLSQILVLKCAFTRSRPNPARSYYAAALYVAGGAGASVVVMGL